MGNRLTIISLLFLTSFNSFCQQEVLSDFETWLSVEATKRFDFDLSISLEQQVRLVEYSRTFTQIGISYKVFDVIDLGTELRFNFPRGEMVQYRFGGYIGLETGKDDLQFEYRFKTQSTFSKLDATKLTLRNKVTAKYTIKKDWRLATSFELFLPKEDGRFWLKKYRWIFGLRYKINKMHLITVFYGIDRNGDLDLDDPIDLKHIFGTKYNLRW